MVYAWVRSRFTREVNLAALRFTKQNDLSVEDYYGLMMDNIDEVADKRLVALRDIGKEKLWVAKFYNRKVRLKQFQVADLVWKVILPIGCRNSKFGKWSPSREGTFWVVRIVPGNSYLVESLEGDILPRALDERHLKKFHAILWQST